jgi:radical SAM protein with 4Fe4S-binding SPASM domain
MMDGKNIIFKKYKKEGYFLYFNKKNGTLIRCEDKGKPEPFYAQSGPELLDVSITGYCTNYCPICYRGSSINGKHISFDDYLLIIEEAKKSNVVQIALGGGNPNTHPDFIKILKITDENGIVPCYTTNGSELSDEILEASKQYCGAIAISYYPPLKRVMDSVVQATSLGIKTNIHFVISNDSIHEAIALLKKPPAFLTMCNAIIFLNYKPVGRGSSSLNLARNSNSLDIFFELIQKKYPFKVGFDSCAISGIVTKTKINKDSVDFCEAGRFSAFINEFLDVYPCSFLENKVNGVNLKETSLLNIWRNKSSFRDIRNRLRKNENCLQCQHYDQCHGGCPHYDINFCEQDH